MPSITTAQTSDLQVKAISREVNKYLYRHSFFAPVALGDSKGLPTVYREGDPRPGLFDLSNEFGQNQRKGTTISVPDIQQRLFKKTKLENAPLEYQTQAAGQVNLTITAHEYVAVRKEDYQSFYNNVNGYDNIVLEAQMEALCSSIEQSFFGLIPSFTFNPTIGSGSGYAVSTTDLKSAERILFSANVPTGLKKHFICNPHTYESFTIERDEYQVHGDQGVEIFNTQRFYKPIASFNVQRSNYIDNSGGASKQLAFTDNAFMFGFGFKPRTQTAKNLSYLAEETVVDMLFGVAIKRQQFAVQIDGDDTNNIT